MEAAKALLGYLLIPWIRETEEPEEQVPDNTQLQAMIEAESPRSSTANIQEPADTQAMTAEPFQVITPFTEPVDVQLQGSLISEVHGNRYSVDDTDPSALQMIRAFQLGLLRPISQSHQHLVDSFGNVSADDSTISRVKGDKFDIGKRAPKVSTTTPESVQMNPPMYSTSRLWHLTNTIIEETDGHRVTVHS